MDVINEHRRFKGDDQYFFPMIVVEYPISFSFAVTTKICIGCLA